MPLTDKKRRYAEARLAGQGKKDSAIAAGCPEKTASQAASRYEKDKDVIAHMDRQEGPATQKPQTAKKDSAVPEPGSAEQGGGIFTGPFNDPLEFMEAMMNDIAEDPKLRLDAAKSLAAFKHAKPGQGGKKDEKQGAAKQAAQGKFRSAPPPLKAVK